MIVTDTNVAPLYLKALQTSLDKSGIENQEILLPPGEESKNMFTLNRLYNAFSKGRITRADGIIALGGGVVGDLAGFAAATFMRGINLFLVPTTLLAQVDAAIGGKNGIDTAFGKNMLGTFYQPKAVLVDLETLNTLSPSARAQGMAEVIKYACILEKDLFLSLETGNYQLEKVITRCIAIKAGLVAEDEFDRAKRKLLNFGHTIGHALEKAMDYRGISHGRAVAIGMVTALQVGETLTLTPLHIRARLCPLLASMKLPTTLPIGIEKILPHLQSDKKRQGETIDFILLKDLGESFIQPLSFKKLELILKEVSIHG